MKMTEATCFYKRKYRFIVIHVLVIYLAEHFNFPNEITDTQHNCFRRVLLIQTCVCFPDNE